MDPEPFRRASLFNFADNLENSSGLFNISFVTVFFLTPFFT